MAAVTADIAAMETQVETEATAEGAHAVDEIPSDAPGAPDSVEPESAETEEGKTVTCRRCNAETDPSDALCQEKIRELSCAGPAKLVMRS